MDNQITEAMEQRNKELANRPPLGSLVKSKIDQKEIEKIKKENEKKKKAVENGKEIIK